VCSTLHYDGSVVFISTGNNAALDEENTPPWVVLRLAAWSAAGGTCTAGACAFHGRRGCVDPAFARPQRIAWPRIGGSRFRVRELVAHMLSSRIKNASIAKQYGSFGTLTRIGWKRTVILSNSSRLIKKRVSSWDW
jgi:hypothetical protein